MKASRFVLAAVSLLLLVVAAQDVFAQRRWRAKEEVEAGGWYAAYGNEVTEEEAARGIVDAGVSLQSGDIESLRTWSGSLLRQAIALMVHDLGPEEADRFGRDEQREARRFSVETIRDLLGSRTAGAQILVSGAVEVKAGVIEHRVRREEYSRHRETVFMPYIAIRLKHGRRHHSEYRDDWRNRNGYDGNNYRERRDYP